MTAPLTNQLEPAMVFLQSFCHRRPFAGLLKSCFDSLDAARRCSAHALVPAARKRRDRFALRPTVGAMEPRLVMSDVSGTWTGYNIPLVGGAQAVSTQEMDLTQTGSSVSGSREGAVGPFFAAFTLKGTVTDNRFSFQDLAITDQRMVSGYDYFLFDGVLTISSDGHLMEGTWHAADGGPEHGLITLDRPPATTMQGTTTTTLASSPEPSPFGQRITLTAAVRSASRTPPTGVITFRDDSTILGYATVPPSGVATFTTPTLPVGTHSLTATYSGDMHFQGSASSPILQVVNPAVVGQAEAVIALTSTTNPAPSGGSITLTATASANGSGLPTPTGLVTFLDEGTVLGSGTLDANGAATLTTSTLAAGTHQMTALYTGDANYSGSASATLSQVIRPTVAVSPPDVTGASVATHTRRGITSVKVGFDEALEPSSAANRSFYGLAGLGNHGRRGVHASAIVYDDADQSVVIRLARPRKGRRLVTVQGGIEGANGAVSSGTFRGVIG
jgi:hypothetical protein